MELNGFSLQFIKTVFNFILLLLLFLAQSLSIHFDLEKSPWAVPHALGPTTCPGLYHMPWAQFADNERTAVFSAPSGLPAICQKKRHSQSSMFLFFFQFLQFPLQKHMQLFIKCLYLEVLFRRQKEILGFFQIMFCE